MIDKSYIEDMEELIKVNICPIMINSKVMKMLHEDVKINSNCELTNIISELDISGQKAPDWFYKLENTSKEKERTVLVIDGIDKIEKQQQLKFKDLIKNRKVGNFELPSNTVIFISLNGNDSSKVSDVIKSLSINML